MEKRGQSLTLFKPGLARPPSPSAAIALMIGRYGRHLLETWELSAARYPEPSPEQFQPASAIAPAAVNDFQFSDPINF